MSIGRILAVHVEALHPHAVLEELRPRLEAPAVLLHLVALDLHSRLHHAPELGARVHHARVHRHAVTYAYWASIGRPRRPFSSARCWRAVTEFVTRTRTQPARGWQQAESRLRAVL